jgi:iron complex transport system ATP-binding protein
MNVLELTNVSAGHGATMVLHHASHRFAPHRLTALIGPNGCGKSTLLRAVMGRLPTVQGTIALDGAPVARIGRRALARRIAYLPQENYCPDYMTLGELIELAGYARYRLLGGPSEHDRTLFRQALETVGLMDMAGRPINALSGGQRQRAWIALAIAQDTEIILLDEPVNHLDPKYQYAILGLLRDLTHIHGKTVIAVLHDINLTNTFADEVVLLQAGSVLAAGPVHKTMTAANIARGFDIETDVFEYDGRLVCLPHPPGGPR